MPASPLVAALVGEGGGQGAMAMDPTMLQVMPQLQLAQAMRTQGMDASPAHPMQALARVLQGTLGGYMQQSATSDLAKAYAASAENTAKALEQVAPGHPLTKALRSPDPTVRMMALQQAGKVWTLLSQPENLAPGHQVGLPGATQPLTESTAPQSEPGRVAVDTRRGYPLGPAVVYEAGKAGAVAGAKAPYESGGEVDETRPASATTPAGVVRRPISAAERANMGGGPQPGSSAPIVPNAVRTESVPPPNPVVYQPEPMGPADASGAPALVTTKDQGKVPPLPPGAPGAPRAPLQIAPVSEVERSKAQGKEQGRTDVELGAVLNRPPLTPGLGTTEPLKTDHGTIIPPASKQAPPPTNPVQAKEAVGAWQKTTNGWSESLMPGYNAEQRLGTIAGAFKDFQTGSWATTQADWRAKLNAVGIHLADKVLADPAKVQLALHENYIETIQQLKAANSRWTQMEFKALSANREHPDIQPAANLQMLGEDIATLRQARHLTQDFELARRNGWQDPHSFQQHWLQENPLKRYVENVKSEVGPLKGMPGSATTPPDAAGGQERKVLNGKPYIKINGTWHAE